MFNKTNIKKLSKLMNIKDLERVEIVLKKQAKYLKVNSSYLLKSYIVIYSEQEKEFTRKKVYKTKNIYIIKYMEEILKNYHDGFGYLKISKSLDLNHKIKVSKSSIEHFIKSNNIERGK